MGRLFDAVTAFPNLLEAARLASKGKRGRPNVAAFSLALEEELHRLQDELVTRSYRPGPYRTFIVREKKPRLISAAPFRDRVVHHAFYRVVGPIFERGFLMDSYACQKGKGTHAAVERASRYGRRFRYVLKCDIEKYFPSIDHDILFGLLARRIHDDGVLWLVRLIIDGSNPQQEILRYFPGDALFSPCDRRRGIPIGNQTSQFFANVYLNGLDHYAKETLHLPGYLRYVDDFLSFSNDKGQLHAAQEAMTTYCEGLRLTLHPRKCFVAPVTAGFTFLGYRIFPSHRRVEADNVRRFKRRLRHYLAQVLRGQLAVAKARDCVQSWLAHAGHADTSRLRGLLREGFERVWPGVPRRVARGVGQVR